tara:strand:+ start:752 stop:1645 length:894 start_codon:yes stop_codon:yes gene_type:complete
MLHVPVLLEESINFLIKDQNGFYIDGTFGRGGHSKSILKKISSNGRLYAFDKDPESIDFGKKIKNDNFKIIHDSFKNFDNYFEHNSIDGILFDLGTCSTHLDNPDRGFSFMKDGPLDMRFNKNIGIPVKDWLINASREEIQEILYKYGDEKHAKLISSAIYDENKKKLISTTLRLAEIVENNYPLKKNNIHPATKTFQAFRIYINDELNDLKKSLYASKKILKTGGVVVTISFHSLEDNIIKNFFKPTNISYPKDIPINNETIETFKCIGKKIRPNEDEVEKNIRSRSAIMRVFKKI